MYSYNGRSNEKSSYECFKQQVARITHTQRELHIFPKNMLS